MVLAAAGGPPPSGVARVAGGGAGGSDPRLRRGGGALLQPPRHRQRAADALCSEPGTEWGIADLLDDAAGAAAGLPSRRDPALLVGMGPPLLSSGALVPAGRGAFLREHAAFLPDSDFGDSLIYRCLSTLRAEGAHLPRDRGSGGGRPVAGKISESPLLCAGHRAGAVAGGAGRAIPAGEVWPARANGFRRVVFRWGGDSGLTVDRRRVSPQAVHRAPAERDSPAGGRRRAPPGDGALRAQSQRAGRVGIQSRRYRRLADCVGARYGRRGQSRVAGLLQKPQGLGAGGGRPGSGAYFLPAGPRSWHALACRRIVFPISVMLQNSWGRPPGLRGSSRIRSSRNEISHIPAPIDPTWTSAAGLESCPTINAGAQLRENYAALRFSVPPWASGDGVRDSIAGLVTLSYEAR